VVIANPLATYKSWESRALEGVYLIDTTVQFWSDSMVILVSVLLIAGVGKQTGLVTGPWLLVLLITTLVSHLLAIIVERPQHVDEGIHDLFQYMDMETFSKLFYSACGIIVLALSLGSPAGDIISQLVALLPSTSGDVEKHD
jgi:hypothetical protein